MPNKGTITTAHASRPVGCQIAVIIAELGTPIPPPASGARSTGDRAAKTTMQPTAEIAEPTSFAGMHVNCLTKNRGSQVIGLDPGPETISLRRHIR
jgi:hypothetical protein